LIGTIGAAAAFAGMVATPLARRGGPVRRGAAAVVVVGLAVTTFDRIRSCWGTGRAGASAVTLTALGWAAEAVGTRTGRPFGDYAYTGRLRPTVGGVPALVPLAWFAMAAPARETAHAALGRRSTPIGRVVVGAAALVAWDLFLDPQMVAEGYWRWARQGRYRGIPVTNYLGWFATAVAVMALLERTVPPDRPPDAGLVGEYAGVAAMETLGFAVFFRDRGVALAGGAAMLPVAAAGLRSVLVMSD
jgi:putative membrane protein